MNNRIKSMVGDTRLGVTEIRLAALILRGQRYISPRMLGCNLARAEKAADKLVETGYLASWARPVRRGE